MALADILAQQAALGRTGATQAGLQAPGIVARSGQNIGGNILQAASLAARLQVQQQAQKQQQQQQQAELLQRALMQQAQLSQQKELFEAGQEPAETITETDAIIIEDTRSQLRAIDEQRLKFEGVATTPENTLRAEALKAKRIQLIQSAMGSVASPAAKQMLQQQYGGDLPAPTLATEQGQPFTLTGEDLQGKGIGGFFEQLFGQPQFKQTPTGIRQSNPFFQREGVRLDPTRFDRAAPAEPALPPTSFLPPGGGLRGSTDLAQLAQLLSDGGLSARR